MRNGTGYASHRGRRAARVPNERGHERGRSPGRQPHESRPSSGQRHPPLQRRRRGVHRRHRSGGQRPDDQSASRTQLHGFRTRRAPVRELPVRPRDRRSCRVPLQRGHRGVHGCLHPRGERRARASPCASVRARRKPLCRRCWSRSAGRHRHPPLRQPHGGTPGRVRGDRRRWSESAGGSAVLCLWARRKPVCREPGDSPHPALQRHYRCVP